jgi:hypothetical protein
MSCSFGSFCTQNLLPPTATLLRKQYTWNSQSTNPILPRLNAFATIPVALLSAARHAVHAPFGACAKLADLKPVEATKSFCRDISAAFKLLILAIANVAYAILGLFSGAYIFRQFQPEPFQEQARYAVEEVENLWNQAAQLQQELERERAAQQIQQQNLTNLENQLNIHRTQSTSDRNAVQTLEQTLTDKRNNEQKLTADLTEIRKAIHEKENNISTLTERLTDTEKNLRNLNRQNELEGIRFNIHTQLNKQKRSLNSLLKKITAPVNLERDSESIQDLSNFLGYMQKRIDSHLCTDLSTPLYLSLPKMQQDDNTRQTEDLLEAIARSYEHTLEYFAEVEETITGLQESMQPARNSIEQEPRISSPSQESSSSNQARIHSLPNLYEVGQNAIQYTANKTKQLNKWLLDGDDPWKAQRYQIAIEYLASIAQDEMSLIIGSDDSPEHLEALKAVFIKMQSLSAYTDFSPDPKELYFQFQNEIRSLLCKLDSPQPPILKQEVRRALNQICKKLFTELPQLPFGLQAISYVASKGQLNPQGLEDRNLSKQFIEYVQRDDVPLSERLELFLKGIKQAPSLYKAPFTSLYLAKLRSISPTYDPIGEGNIATQLAEMVFKDPVANETRKIIITRTGVPIKGVDERSSKNGVSIGDVTIVPEYLAWLREMKAQDKKVLAVLHLDPTYYDTTNEICKPYTWKEFVSSIETMQKKKQALWIELLVNLSKSDEFKDVLDVAVLPLDGDWFKIEIEEIKQNKDHNEFKEWLKTQILKENSLFRFPTSISRPQLEEILTEIANQVDTFYFEPNSPGVEDYTFDKKKMRAFVGLFYSLLIERLGLTLKADVIQRNCKDAVDRTMALIGGELSEKFVRLGKFDQPKIKDQIMGTTLSPALTNTKRELLDSRKSILIDTIKQLETVGNRKIASPKYCGFSLEDVVIKEDPKQTLFPSPSKAADIQQYQEILRREIECPFILSKDREINIPQKTEGEIQPQLPSNLLFDFYTNIQENPTEGGYDFQCINSKEFQQNPSIDQIKKEFEEFNIPEACLQRTLNSMTPDGWNRLQSLLGSRYENAGLDIDLQSKEDSLYCTFTSENTEKMKMDIIKDYAIVKTDDSGEPRTLAALQITLTLDMKDPNKLPHYRYEIK